MNDGTALPSVFDAASPQAAHAATVSWVLIVGATAVFVLVMGVLAAALWRQRRGTARARAWLGVGVVLPAGVLLALTAWLAASADRTAPHRDEAALLVRVTARSWWWEVQYLTADGSVRTANEIHLPADRPVTLALTSDDVIHSFWVPALGGKVDMLPGRVLHLRLAALAPGTYRGQCAEFCGEQHARMALRVVVHAGDGFERWQARERQPASSPSDALAQQGWRVFEQRRCGACHPVRGLAPDGSGGRGPDLTHVGSRLTLGAGTLRNGEDALHGWLSDVQRHKPGARMPSSPPDAQGTAALAHFLAQLR